MAGISTGSNNGKRALDHEIPLVPFIDLLLCCVMFLLVTAVWNKLASVDVDVPGEGTESSIAGPAPEQVPVLMVSVTSNGVELADTSSGVELLIPRIEGQLDLSELNARVLAGGWGPAGVEAWVRPDDGVDYAAVISVMDVLRGRGIDEIMLGDS